MTTSRKSAAIANAGLRVALYLRVSTDDQEGGLETQEVELTRYCARESLVVTETYRDDGVSGTVPLELRPAGARLFSAAALGEFQAVVVYKLDRFGRDPLLLLGSIARLKATGVSVLSATQPIEDSPEGRLLTSILSGFAGYEREIIRQRSMAGRHRAAATGRWLGGPVPYGYRIADVRLVPNETEIPAIRMSEADVVRLAFRMLAEDGLSCYRVAERLNAIGVPTRKPAPGRKQASVWGQGRVLRLIRARTYMGEHPWLPHGQEEPILRQVPALVDRDTWERANRQIVENRHTARGPIEEYLLRGLIFCGVCGNRFSGTVSRPPGCPSYRYYQCWGRDSRAVNQHRGRCESPRLRADAIEREVWETITHTLRNPEAALLRMETRLRGDSADLDGLLRERARLESLLASKSGEVNTVVTLARRGMIPPEVVDEQLGAIAAEEAGLRREIEAVGERVRAAQEIDTRVANAAALLEQMRAALDGQLSFEQRRTIVQKLVRSVTVDPDGTAHVDYWWLAG
jgi:site-specific DNA recombinase